LKLPLTIATILASVGLLLGASTLWAAVLVPDDGPVPTPRTSSGSSSGGNNGSSSDRRAVLSGTVWFDANVNGRPDTAERAVRNIQIDLEGPNAYRESRKTVENGTYEFAQLAAGTYKLTIHLPAGFGLSLGESGKAFMVDGRSTIKDADFGIARADQLPSPSANVTAIATGPSAATVTDPPAPRSAPPIVPIATAPAVPPAGSSVLPGVGFSPPAPRQVTPTNQPTGTSIPTETPVPVTPTPDPTPSDTPTATPTRTPSAIDGQQAAAERARAGLESAGNPRTGSVASGDDVMLDVPFRSALDGSEYADTNSGTAALAMAIEAYGDSVTTADLRALSNTLTRNYDVGTPPRLEVLVRVAEQAGLRGLGLNQGVRLAVWTADGVRERLRSGYPVLTQIRPDNANGDGELGRERFVLIIGLKDNSFVYHDPAYPDTQGQALRMPLAQLNRAWSNSPNSAQAAALALGPAEVGLLAGADVLTLAQQAPDRPPIVREVPTPAPPAPAFGFSASPPVPSPEAIDQYGTPIELTAPSAGSLPFHPLLLSFWLVAGAVLIRVVGGLVLD
jgi:hypothetical protein